MPLLRLLRPQQWIKNLLIFVPLFFAGGIFINAKIWSAVFAFLAFSLLASSVYVFNDIVDKDNDAKHPVKKNRPIANNQVSVAVAGILIVFLLFSGFSLILFTVPQIFWLALIYLILNILYSFYLKHVPIVDIILIAGFYLLRVEIGGLATATPLSRWLILCVIFSSLLLVIGKRSAEFKHENKRAVLFYYNENLLNQLLSISACLTIVSYGLYSVLGISSQFAVYSVFLVLLGIGRYLLLVFSSPEVEYPEKIVFKDKIIFLSFIGWIIFMFLIFYQYV